jgi:DNA-binding response OmpR family regulator
MAHPATDSWQTSDVETSGFGFLSDANGEAESSFSFRRDVDASAPRHILVVDDDRACRETVAQTIGHAGFRADTAQDGEDGWRALCLGRFDLMITDNEMPRLDGLNLIRRVRSVSATLPCILMSGKLPLPESDLQEIVRPGAVLAKPFSRVALIEQVLGLLLRGEF